MTKTYEVQKCKVCGEFFQEPHYECKDDNICFSCYHWTGQRSIDEIDPDSTVIVGGHHYRIRPETERYKGFAGAKWIIQFLTGYTVTTTNLWHQGEIPEFWRPTFPDNARFLQADSDPGIATS